jgi:hypothetical protein
MHDENGEEMEPTDLHGKKQNHIYDHDRQNPSPRWDPFLNGLPLISSSSFIKGDQVSSSKRFANIDNKSPDEPSETPFKSLPVSMSIGSPRSVFEPVQHSVLSQYHISSFERGADLLQPHFRENFNHGNKIQLDSKNSEDQYFFPSISIKDKPLEHKFKPIVLEDDIPLNTPAADVQDVVLFPQGQDKDHDFIFPQVEVNALSSRAKRRSRIPFTHVIIRDDGSSCTDVSAISYDSFEFEMDDFASSAVKDHRVIDVEANYTLLQETKELMDRIARHNLGNDADEQTNRNQDTNLDEPTLGIFGLRRVGILDKENILEETGRLLSQIEELPLPGDIAALMDEEETQQLANKGVGKNEMHLPPKERRPSIIEEMDLAFSDDAPLQQQKKEYSVQKSQKKEDSLQKSQIVPLDIEALIQDDDLSFDDLREDTEDEYGEKLLVKCYYSVRVKTQY